MIKIEDVSFFYTKDDKQKDGIRNINLEIRDGELVVFCGKSGCGKTTMTRIINGLAPHFYEGYMEGHLYIDGIDVPREPLKKISTIVGSVFQNPKSQFFHTNTTGEILFGCENRNMSKEEMDKRLKETSEIFLLDPLLDRNIFELSGGEKQQIACGSVYASKPSVFVMDEPTSNLDKKAINRLKKVISELKKEGKTVIISEHRLYFLMDLADRFIYMRNGQIEREFVREEMQSLSSKELEELGLRTTDLKDLKGTPVKNIHSEPMIEIEDFSCQKGNDTIVDIETLNFPKNNVIALIGDNGTGKSTLAEALCGTSPSSGSVSIDGKVLDAKERVKECFMVMQDVNRQLFCENVLEELKLNSNISDEEALEILDKLDILEQKDKHPSSLSGGQKQRVAIASAISSKKKIIFYDEPTSGLDHSGMVNFSKLINDVKTEVDTSVIITHDLELILNCCTYVVHMEKGSLVSAYPLDADGIEKVKYYFLTEKRDAHTSERESGSVTSRIIRRMGEYKKYFYAAIAFMTLGSVLGIVPFGMIYKIADLIISGRDNLFNRMIPYLGCMILFAF
nr:ABC transporter ATP-binding protein [Lachnospiraceae bacterium]